MKLDERQLGTLMGAIPGSTVPAIWEIRHSSGMQASVDLTAHVANLPGALTVWDAAVQQHEQGHVRWDLPHDKLGALAPALVMPSVLPWYKMMREWVIDLRLVMLAESDPFATDPRIGMDRFDWSNMPDPKGRPEETLAQWWSQYAYVYTGSASQELRNYTGEIWSLLPNPVRDLLTAAFLEVTDHAAAYDDDVSAMWAVKLAAHWDASRTQQAPQPPVSPQYQQAQQEAGNAKAKTQMQAQQTQEAMSGQGATPPDPTVVRAAQNLAQAMQAQPGTDDTNGMGGQVAQSFASEGAGQRKAKTGKNGKQSGPHSPTTMAWGQDVTICNHVTTAAPGKRLKAPKGASEEGVVIVDLPRVFQDRRPFKNAPRPAGTIIVDTSGSMSWSQPELEEVIRRSPNVVVGLYNAFGAPHASGARICIVARDGRAANLEHVMMAHRFSGGNDGSDAPALRWLADRHQKGPKFILSDGEFWDHSTIVPISDYRYCVDVCESIMKKGKILRVPTFADMIAIANYRPALISDGSEYSHPTKRRANNR